MAIGHSISRRALMKAAPAATALALVPAVALTAPAGDDWLLWAEKEFHRLIDLHKTPAYWTDEASDRLSDEYCALMDKICAARARTFKGLAVKARLLGYWDDRLTDDDPGDMVAPKVFKALLADLEALS